MQMSARKVEEHVCKCRPHWIYIGLVRLFQCVMFYRSCNLWENGFTNMEKANKHFMYGTASGHNREARRLYMRLFSRKDVSQSKNICALASTVVWNGILSRFPAECKYCKNDQNGNCGRWHTWHVGHEPSTSTWTIGRILVVPHCTTWRVLTGKRLHPYHGERTLTVADYPRRVDFARWVLQQGTVSPKFLASVFFIDKCNFTCDGAFKISNQLV